ncbi:MAG: alcohol dehydrogenase [Acidimicrobiales bacterium]|jgi:NADPH2:quinone reductase|nr:alcohol dehydrogenase [Acidimicrobiales bacterium]
MRAWRVHELGEPADVLTLDDVDEPVAGPGQVVIDIEAASVNFPDLLQCRGEYQVKPPLPFVVGSEIGGRIAAVGEGVSDFAIGQRVCALAGSGGLAERASAAAMTTFAIPDELSTAAATALPVNYQTVWFALVTRAALQQGETLLVHAGAGGVGSGAIQVGRALGARVIATAGGPDKVAVCQKLGADVAIDYNTEDFVAAVKDATGGAGADVIFDPVGGDVFDRSRKAIAFDGRLLVIGFTSGRIPDIPANHVLLKNYSVVGVHWGAYVGRDPGSLARNHVELVRLVESGDVDPLVGAEFAFADAAAALTALGTRRTVGKVVVRPGG